MQPHSAMHEAYSVRAMFYSAEKRIVLYTTQTYNNDVRIWFLEDPMLRIWKIKALVFKHQYIKNTTEAFKPFGDFSAL